MELGNEYTNLASSIASSEEIKNEEFKVNDVPPSRRSISRSSIVDAVSSNPATRSSRKQSKFRQLHEVDQDNYDLEAALMEIIRVRDIREVVRDTTVYPFSAHGRLVMMYNGKTVYGSGTLISSRFMLTAAHNIYSRYYEREPDSILFIPGLNGSECPYGIIAIRRYFYLEEYKIGRTEDYCLIELEEDIGESTGFIEMKMHRSEEVDGKECSIYGYPISSEEIANNQLHGMSGTVSVIGENNLLRYYIFTSPGQSGSCIYYISPEDNKYFTLGVHVKGYSNRGYKTGTFFSSERIEQINEWMLSDVIPTKHNLISLTTELYGRDSELNRLRDYMADNIQHGIIGLSGIAGVGKSTIALKFATKSIGSYDYIWWINSENDDIFQSYILDLADTLSIEGKSFQEKLSKLKVIINSPQTKFLLIIDNLENVNIVQDLFCTRGHYIITTRLDQIGFNKIEVSALSREASVQLLSSRLPDKPHDEYELLANFLEDLPLALLQAASYIKKYNKDITEYIEELSDAPDRDERLKSIVSKNIQPLSEECQDILKIVCLGHHDNIPYDMLYTVFSYKYLNTTQNQFDSHLSSIVRLNIMSYDIQTELLKIHRVIHKASRSIFSNSLNDELVRAFSEYLYINYMPESNIHIQEQRDQIKTLTFHAVELVKKYKSRTPRSRAAVLYSRLAYAFNTFFLNYETSNIYAVILQQYLVVPLEENEFLAQVYNNLGLLYRSLEKYRTSELYYLRCLILKETSLPSNHPDLAAIYISLGFLYKASGEYRRSEEYYLKCLRIREANLPANHNDLATIYNDLGELYLSMGNYRRSEDYYLRCLAIRVAILPENHPDLATIYKNLEDLNNQTQHR